VLRTPVYDEMVNIAQGNEATFSKYKFNEVQARSFFENYAFTNQRNANRSMITWYAYTFPEQKLLGLSEVCHLEHIYSKKRQEMEGSLKAEISINIKASDYRF
jgi:hypothetical protein